MAKLDFPLLPTLTPGGRVCYFVGLTCLGLWVKLDHAPLFLLGVSLMSAVAFAWVWVWLGVRSLTVTVRRPQVARAWVPSRASLEVRSRRRIRGLVATNPRNRLTGLATYFEKVTPAAPCITECVESWPQRGVFDAHEIQVTCARPFGLVEATRTFRDSTPITVLPARGRLRGPLARVAAGQDRPQARPKERVGVGTETLHVRPHVPGDPLRRIHWPSSARRGRLMSREWCDEGGGTLTVGLGSSHHSGAAERRRFEIAVAIVATLLHEAGRQNRDAVLLLPGEAPLRVPAGNRLALRNADLALTRVRAHCGWPDWSFVSGGGASNGLLILGSGDRPHGLPPGVRVISAQDSLDRGWFTGPKSEDTR